ncbi:hypothetical protein SISNIDRAFT_538527 [Sistotremastrum niveocremeum HHB9708]|uniref:cystathionine gamma-lyase n=1 Tax=Sistotremastrum niveocremeum HHB9708 TaxID=1314777 RepID=A0A164MSV1_9AGAM|nr:hypothetical protein SISNIDRAFT_538527 [Sistotremastrum niveocremeum HHB9708]
MPGFNTRAIHVGSEPDPSSNAVIPPISLSTTFKQDKVGVHKGYEYSRSQNPSRAGLENTLAALEAGGQYALAFASGSAATATIIQSLGPDAHIVSVNDVYGGTFRYMDKVAREVQGLQTTFVDFENASDEEIIGSLKENTKLIWIESPTNPTLRVIDIPRIARLVRTHSQSSTPPLVLVDNTFPSPFFSSPLLLGADIVSHSLTKYINGHSDSVSGALIFPPHHSALFERLKYLQNAIGAVPSAFDSWLVQRGAKTLGVRMKQHGKNALAVARALEKSPYVKEVIYPGLRSHPGHKLAWGLLSPHAKKWILEEGYGGDEGEGEFPFSGMVTFRIGGDEESAERFLEKTELFTLAESLGGVESLAELPAKMTHGSIPPAERAQLGIGLDLVRLSVGIEEWEDLVEDVEQALEWARYMPR